MARSDAIADAILMQSVALARVEADAQDEAALELRGLFTTLRRLLQRLDPTVPAFLGTRLRRITQVREALAEPLTDAYLSLMRSDVERRQLVVPWYIRGLVAGLPEAAASLLTRGRGTKALETVADATPIQGVDASEAWGRQAGTVQQQVEDRLRRAVLNEQAMGALAAEVAAIEQTAIRAAEALVQTSLASVAQAALVQVAEANAEGLRALTWLTTLDSRACPVCIALSGQSWTIDDKRPLGSSGPWPGEPPIHPRCRCVLSVVATGDPLPRDQTFAAWLTTRTTTEQRAILGPGRYALWQRGTLKLRQLIDQRHRPLTLDQLRSDSAA